MPSPQATGPAGPKRAKQPRAHGGGTAEDGAPGPDAEQDADAEVDVVAYFREGKLGKLTVPVLKKFLKSVGISNLGKKADLVQLAETFLVGQGV